MKKSSILLLALAGVVFISSQSFFNVPAKKSKPLQQSSYLAFPKNAAICVPQYWKSDTAINMPALKGWGHYSWKVNSKSDSAQYYFDQGISLYYAFHSIESIASFEKAAAIDPTFAMAWYGKALAMGPTINYGSTYRAPSEALEAAIKSKSLSANCSPLEKDLINAIQVRYSPDTTASLKQLRKDYAKAMAIVYEKHAQNVDATTLYADALLLVHPWDLYHHDQSPKEWTPEIAALLKHAMTLSPSHPGANHFYIHTMEGSAHPELALKSAHLLDTLMPSVSHITHMASHIYVRTGDYKRGIKVNNDAIAGFNNYMAAYSPVANGALLYDVHNVHLKSTCASLAGNYKTAITAADELVQSIPLPYLSMGGADGNYVQYVYSAAVLTDVRFGKWDKVLKSEADEKLTYIALINHFAKGVAYSRSHQPLKAAEEMKKLKVNLTSKDLQFIPDNFSSAYQGGLIAQSILQGLIFEEQHNYKEAITAYNKAVLEEDKLIYNEPRDWPLSSRQYLGNVLTKAAKYKEAADVFNTDLKIHANNGWALTGLAIAYKQLGNTAALSKTNQRLTIAWEIKDTKIDRAVF